MSQQTHAFTGLVECVRRSVANDPGRIAFTFLEFPGRHGARRESQLSVGDLDARARAVATRLCEHAGQGDRALLLYRSGLEFVVGFLGCLYAGVVAVPAAVPRMGLGADRVAAMAVDAAACVALTTAASLPTLRTHLADASLAWIASDDLATDGADAFVPHLADADDLALLQYSSGSTGEPKGVMVSHRNLVHQATLLYDQVGASAGDCWLAWLPLHHDMGLVSAVVTPLVQSLHSVLMAPDAFVARPARWLRALGDFRATCCAAPNFAWELCTRKGGDDELADLDLSALRFAVCGAEPIRAATLARFADRFAPCGFRADAFYPAYGLAEATLLVTGRRGGVATLAFDAAALDEGRAVVVAPGLTNALELASSGAAQGGNEVRIVDADGRQLPAGRIGEIRVAGDSVGLGYWGADAARVGAFAGYVDGDTSRVFLRTGDLGFLHDGELYVRGRSKDLIILRGANHHPADLEQSAEAACAALAPSGSAAFSVDVGDEERLVLVHELEREHRGIGEAELVAIAATVRSAITERHAVAPYAVLLLAGGLPKTSSGKVRRQECKHRYLTGELKALHACTLAAGDSVANDHLADDDGDLRQRIDAELWLQGTFAALLDVPTERIALDARPCDLGLDADALTRAVEAIKREFGLLLPFTAFTDHATLAELAAYLVERADARGGDAVAQGGRLLADALAAPAASGGADEDAPIAVVGLACRFPGADGPRTFWNNICAGLDTVTDVPAERWNGDALYDENPLAMGKMNTRRGGFLRDIESFDARFFGIQAREATRMDPAHRILLELSWEVFEDAGILPDSVSGTRVGVYVGISGSDYAQLQFGDEALSDPYAGIGCALTNAASRISHFHNLRGPAMAVDTACSSSLSAMHLGCTAIRTGECDLAIAGGVNIILSPTVTMSLSKAGMMAPDGRCKTFDKDANGYVRSEGAGLVLLKPLARALADGDPIYALVRGSATNQDGRSSAISAPNGEAQQRVVLAACESAGIAPGELDYVEAHGTGTALGDPIEVNALGEVLRLGAEPGTHCAIGSVKTNIGHCESAAGVASMIKAALVLDHKVIPPSLHFFTPNPLIPFDTYRVQVQQQLAPLPTRSRPRLVGVNSFGIGGTNVHFVLEEVAPSGPRHAPAAATTGAGLHVLPLSARSERALKSAAGALAQHLQANPELALADIAHTLAQRRTHLEQRVVVIGDSAQALAATLETWQQTGYAADAVTGQRLPGQDEPPRVAFVFSGQGSQWWAMGRRLFETEAVYRAEVERCDRALKAHTGWSLIDVLMANEDDSLLGETAYSQPAFFALQVALVALLRAWGIEPDAVVGHSFGEVAAAHVAGALEFEDACRLIAVRARLMQATKGRGRMASIELARAEVEPLLAAHAGELSIAASNGPSTTVVSGSHAALDTLLDAARARGVVVVELGLDYAFHSAQMEDVRRDFVAEIAVIRPLPPLVPLMSTVTGAWCEGTDLLGPTYWGENIRNEVRFRDAIESLARQGTRVFVEISAHPVLSGAVARILKHVGLKGHALSTLERGVDDARAVLRTVGALHAQGLPLDWNALQAPGTFVRGLPHYPWDRQRFWMDAPHLETRRRVSEHPLMSFRMPLAQPTWQSRLDAQVHPHLAALRVRGEADLAPGLAVELAFEALAKANGGPRPDLADLRFQPVRVVDADVLPTVQTTLLRGARNTTVRIAAQTDDSAGRSENWHGVLACRTADDTADTGTRRSIAIDALQGRYPQKFSGAEIYRKLGEIGVEYAPAQHLATDVWLDPGSALIGLRLGELMRNDTDRYHLHPIAFAALEQACRLAAGSGGAQALLRHVRRLRVPGDATRAAFAYCEAVAIDPFTGPRDADDVFRANVWLLDAEGEVLAQAEGVSFAAREQAAADDHAIPEDIDRWRYRVRWDRADAAPVDAAVHPAGASWLVLVDAGEVGDAIVRNLQARGQSCVIVHRGDSYVRQDAATYAVSPQASDDLSRLLAEAFVEPGRALRGVVHLWSLDATAPISTNLASLNRDHALGVLSMTDLVRALSSAELGKAPRLWMVTAGAQAIAAAPRPISLAQSLVWGCAKSTVLEHAELRCARVDLDPMRTAADVALLCEELWADRLDDQIAFRDGERYLARLDYELGSESADDAAQSLPAVFRLLATDTGTTAVATRRRSPGSGEVEIQVDWIDPLAAVPGAPLKARQCTGRVLRVGSEVTSPLPGARVVVLDAGPAASHRVVPAVAAIALPEALAAEQAVGSARDYLAALFALREAAQVTRGDRVLVRFGSDAAALAAVRVARWLGAKVFVAAPVARHAELASMHLAHVFDEADPGARLDVAALTEGRGIDVLINYGADLDGSACAFALRGFGRCIDLAPRAPGGSLPTTLPSNVSLLAVDVDGLVRERRDLLGTLLGDGLARLADGTFAAQSRTTCTLDDIAAGSVLCLPDAAASALAGPYRSDATYVISGGLGGLGLHLAARMVRDGARHLVLLGRRAPSLGAMDVLAELEATGACCVPMAVDVADPASVQAMLAQVRGTLPPIRGVVHAAGILDNGLLVQMDHHQVLAVMPAKVDGAWNLHCLTDSDELDFFVMFSSLASIIGSPGQSNYAAANAFLEALAEHRHATGRAGLAIAWGPWAEAGMAADAHNLQRLATHGMGMIALDKGLDLMEDLIAGGVHGTVGALPMNWAAWGRTRGYAAQTPYFAGLVPQQVVGRSSYGKLTAAMLAGLDAETQLQQLQAAVLRAVCQSLMLDAESLELDVPLTAVGLDSIIALELKDRIESSIDVVVRTNALIAGKSIRALAEQFLAELGGGADAIVEEPAIDALSTEEIEAMLLQLSTEDDAQRSTEDEPV